MEFEKFVSLIQAQLSNMLKDAESLYVTNAVPDELWEMYLDSFPPEHNKVYRQRREYDCSACRSFVRQFGGVVAIKNNTLMSIWDIETGEEIFQPVCDSLSNYVRSSTVVDVFVPSQHLYGHKQDIEIVENKTKRWNHLYIELPKSFPILKGEFVSGKQAEMRDNRNVFKRGLDEFSIDTVKSVLELIADGSLYRGDGFEIALKSFNKVQKEYALLNEDQKNLYTWVKSITIGGTITRLRNSSIGTLLIDIESGMPLDEAVTRYEKIVAPSNYKRPKPIFSEKDVQRAKKKIEDLGYTNSIARRFARLEDITVADVLFANRDAAKSMKGGDVFDELVTTKTSKKAKTFKKVEEISIADFISKVLPDANAIEVLFENELTSNLVSLIAPQNADAPSMFKWSNGFSWAYRGNMADSMKQRVKAAGGKIDGVLRFTIQWNDNRDNNDDLDAHCYVTSSKGSEHIYFSEPKGGNVTSGELDVDIREPNSDYRAKDGVAVENITWAEMLCNGTFRFYVENFSARGAKSGFSAEIEMNGEIYSFHYPHPLKNKETINVADVVYADGKFSIETKLNPISSGVKMRDEWNVGVNTYVPVSAIMYSPNHWEKEKGLGIKHYMFMLKDCINPEQPNGFFNEYLDEKLNEHRKVFEALGNKMHVEDDPKQLSGLGFCATKRATLTCKVIGSTERILKILF